MRLSPARDTLEHRGLKAAVRTNKSAGLFTESREKEVEDDGETDHEPETGHVLTRAVNNDVRELLKTNDVTQEAVADEERQTKEEP